jgi:hypothetical protein
MAMYPPLWFEGVGIPEVDLYIPSKGRARGWTLGVLQSLEPFIFEKTPNSIGLTVCFIKIA